MTEESWFYDFGVDELKMKDWVLKTNKGSFIAGPQRMYYSTPDAECELPHFGIVYGDVRAVMQHPDFSGALFQTASNFDTFETPNYEFPTDFTFLPEYKWDRTQGPAAQLGTLPQLLARAHLTDHKEHNMLAKLQPYKVACTFAGWADLSRADAPPDNIVSKGLVGSWLVEDTNVVLNKELKFIPQKEQNHVSLVLTSAYDYTHPEPYGPLWADVFLKAAYLNTLHAAAELGSKKVVLTLVGGGVFANSARAIVDAIKWAAKHTMWPKCRPELYINIFKKSMGSCLEEIKELL